MKGKVEEALREVRPALQAHGGDIELVDIADDGTVKVRVHVQDAPCPSLR